MRRVVEPKTRQSLPQFLQELATLPVDTIAPFIVVRFLPGLGRAMRATGIA
jgi:hypothetical protein